MPEALVSVIIATDNFARVAVLIESLSKQTVADRLELVFVASEPATIDANRAKTAAFLSVQVVEIAPIVALATARAIGVRRATAPYVFIAETHAYPDPDFCERLVAALSTEWSVVVPGFRNANPVNAFSWAGFLSDYGAWIYRLPEGETDRAPSHDAAFRRSVLMEFGDRLENALTFGDELYLGLKARGHRAWFEPSAGIQHVNIQRWRAFIGERYRSGVLIGGYRSVRWSYGRRLAYAGAAPLIAVVILSRMWRGLMQARRLEVLPIGTIPALVFGVLLKSAGEFRGYIAGAGDADEKRMTGFEVRKLAFNSGEER
jgi:hypothetical protein